MLIKLSKTGLIQRCRVFLLLVYALFSLFSMSPSLADDNIDQSQGLIGRAVSWLYNNILSTDSWPTSTEKLFASAVLTGDINTACQLLDKGADPDIKDNNGVTALMRAIYKDNLNMVQLLLDKGADPNMRDYNNGVTALVTAVTVPNLAPQIVQLLLDKGANPNIKTNNGITALMMAVFNSNLNSVQLLLDKGADPNIKINRGVTALMMAQDASNTEIVKLLKNAPKKQHDEL